MKIKFFLALFGLCMSTQAFGAEIKLIDAVFFCDDSAEKFLSEQTDQDTGKIVPSSTSLCIRNNGYFYSATTENAYSIEVHVGKECQLLAAKKWIPQAGSAPECTKETR